MTDKATPVEEVWITNRRRVVMFAVVAVSALSLPYFRVLNEAMPKVHPGLVALISGLIMAALVYFPMKYADHTYGLSHAIMMGLLVAEFTAYGAPLGFPTPVVISFFFFMFFVGESEADHLWPTTYSPARCEPNCKY